MKVEMFPRGELFTKFTGRRTVVSAPAGFGKTTLVREWSRSQPFPTEWLTVTGDAKRFRSDACRLLENLTRRTAAERNGTAALIVDNSHMLANHTLQKLSLEIPSSMKLVLLSRHRLSFDAAEVAAEDLRFSETESRKFFEKRIGHSLSEWGFSKLHSWARGWAAGMQLLALVVQEYGGVREWEAHFDGGHRYFTDYFSEVWKHVPRKIRGFLRQTAVLDTFNDSFCAAIFGTNHLLSDVLRRRLFIVENSGDYRYEPLFRAFLRQKLRVLPETKRKQWYAKTADWCANNGNVTEAVNLALLAGNGERAASLITCFAPDLLRNAEWKATEQWIGMLSKIEGRQKAQVMLFYCWVYFLKEEFAELSEFLQETGKIIFENQLPDAYKGEWMLLCSFNSFVTKDVEGAVEKGCNAFALLKNGGVYFDAEISLNSGEAQLAKGKIGLNGRMEKAIRYYHLFGKYRLLLPETLTGYGRAAFAETAYETNQLEEAKTAVGEALAIAKKTQNVSMLVPAVITYTTILQKERAFQQALLALEKTKEFVKEKGQLWKLLLAAQEIRILLNEGNIKAAEHLVYENILHAKGNSEQLHEFESLSYVRMLIATKDYDQAELFLEQSLLAAESGDRFGTRIEIMVLRAVVYQKTNRTRKGLEELTKVLELAEMEGYVRTFLDEGEPIFYLLQRVNAETSYVKNLLNCFRKELGYPTSGPVLTKREQDVLRMMDEGFTNKEMAAGINVTLGTVKGYASSLFKKLDVHNRTQAVARGRELNLL